MRARVAVVAVVAVYLILAPHPKNKEQKLKLEKMVFKDWSESKKQKEQNIGCLVCRRQQTARGYHRTHFFNFYIYMLHTDIIAVSFY